jgi:predicted amino acid-binding ACT domain protein
MLTEMAMQGAKVEVRAADRSGLLSDFSRVLREHGMSLLRAELKRQKDEAIGTFHLVTDSGGQVRPEALRAVRTRVSDMGISLDIITEAPGWPPVRKTSVPASATAQERPGSSLGTLLWSHLGKLSNNFGYIRS